MFAVMELFGLYLGFANNQGMISVAVSSVVRTAVNEVLYILAFSYNMVQLMPMLGSGMLPCDFVYLLGVEVAASDA